MAGEVGLDIADLDSGLDTNLDIKHHIYRGFTTSVHGEQTPTTK